MYSNTGVMSSPLSFYFNESSLMCNQLAKTRQGQYDGVKHNALELEHMFVNRSIQSGSVASKNLYNRDAVVLTLVRPV